MADEKKKGDEPNKKHSSGLVQVAEWINKSKEGNEFSTFKPSNAYSKNDEILPTDSYSLADLSRLHTVIGRVLADRIKTKDKE